MFINFNNTNVSMEAIDELCVKKKRGKVITALDFSIPDFEHESTVVTAHGEIIGLFQITSIKKVIHRNFTIEDFHVFPMRCGLGTAFIGYLSEYLNKRGVKLYVSYILDRSRGFWQRMIEKRFLEERDITEGGMWNTILEKGMYLS